MSQFQSPAYMHPLLPHWLRRFFYSNRGGVSRKAGYYGASFLAAQARSITWGLKPPPMEALPIRYAVEPTVSTVRWHLHQSIGHLSREVVAAERFGVTASVRAILEGKLKTRLAYTLGYVMQDGQRLCHTPIAGLEQMLRAGTVPAGRLSLHAWLTLASHEIIDVCFWAQFPDLCCAEESEMRCLFMHPDQMPGRSYCPQWVGDGFVRGIGVLKEYEKW